MMREEKKLDREKEKHGEDEGWKVFRKQRDRQDPSCEQTTTFYFSNFPHNFHHKNYLM